ncbi:unnamed protein product [marine sediment metagenome]|uniref:Uncharacterized protein n=1 Tax=marine sediment metagenome TaxID=412755 RepID=X0VQD8_9ZZZZ
MDAFAGRGNVLTFSTDGNTFYFGTLGAGVWKRAIERWNGLGADDAQRN